MRKAMFLLVLALALVTAYAVGQSTTATPSSSAPQATQSTPSTQLPDKTANLTDQDLEKQLREQLVSFPNVQFTVNHGMVALEGNVISKEERKRAKELALAVPGVRKVKDHLKISALASATGSTSASQAATTAPASSAAGSSSLQSKIEDALRKEPSLAISNLNVNVTNENVTLNGSVASEQERERAREVAQRQAGDRMVINNITLIAPGSATPSTTAPSTTAGSIVGAQQPPQAGAVGTTGTTPPSGTTGAPVPSEAAGMTTTGGADVKGNIETALRAEPSLATSNINVNVTSTNVMLSGTVSSEADKAKAQEIAQRQAGSLIVINNLTVGNLSSSAAGVSSTGGVAGAVTSTMPRVTGAATATTGAIAGQQQPSRGTAGAATEAAATTSDAASSKLQSDMKTSFQQNNLSGVTAMVTDTTIKLSGSVATGKEKLQAKRLAQSFAQGRRVVDHITVTGRGHGANLQKGESPKGTAPKG